jgi:oligoribonuclease (3'-5' exoribonuclease)
MAETNGTGRLDRIEASLERTTERLNQLTEKFHLMVDHHEAEFKTLMTWQVLMQDKMGKFEAARDADREDAARERRRLDQLWENTDKRIADLVGAISSVIAWRPTF